MEIKRGDVIDIDFDPARGHEIRKTRPAVVVQNDIGNQYSPLVIVSPIRGAEHIKKPYPVIVFVDKGAGEGFPVWLDKVFIGLLDGEIVCHEGECGEGKYMSGFECALECMSDVMRKY